MPLPVLKDKKEPPPEENEGADEEKRLVREAKDGNTEAFGKLVERYQRRVYTVIYRFVRNHTEADDLAQEAFIRAFRAIDRFDLRYPFSPWMYRIAINLTLNHLKKRKLPMVDTDLERKPSADNPVGAHEQNQTRRKVHAAIARLPLKLRQVLVLRAYEDWPYSRIAQILDIPIGTVMSRLARARQTVKEELKELL